MWVEQVVVVLNLKGCEEPSPVEGRAGEGSEIEPVAEVEVHAAAEVVAEQQHKKELAQVVGYSPAMLLVGDMVVLKWLIP